MTAKELRQAAEYAVTMWDNHDSKRLVAGDELFFNSDGEPDSVTFARHILSTVRDDDDEPVTTEWFAGTLDQPIDASYSFGFGYIIALNEVGQWEAWMDDNCLRAIKTRGQFRSLCKGLGIEMKEKTC